MRCYIHTVVVEISRVYVIDSAIKKNKTPFSKVVMLLHCSHCTAASCSKPGDTLHQCSACANGVPYTCKQCVGSHEEGTPLCYLCNVRPHICLSKCLRGCIMRPVVYCACNLVPRRLRVGKKNDNFGRYFFTCNVCKFFQWESEL